MTDRMKALTYGVLIASVASLALLIGDSPSGTTLSIAIASGIAGGIGSYAWMVRH